MSRGGDGGLSGAALSALGGRPLRGFAASLPAGSVLSSFGERLRRGFFCSPAAGCSASPGACSFAGASRLSLPQPGPPFAFAHELIDLLKGHYHIAGIGLCGPGLFLLRCGSGGLFGSQGLGLASRYSLGSLRDFFSPGPVFSLSSAIH